MEKTLGVKNRNGSLADLRLRDIRAKDTAMALVFLFLLLDRVFQLQWNGRHLFELAAMLTALVALVSSRAFVPASKLWFGLSEVLGQVSSKILLTGVFLVVVVPVAMIRKLSGHAGMRLKEWKKSEASVFEVREHCFQASDMKHPF